MATDGKIFGQAPGIDRNQLLARAADQLNALRGDMGGAAVPGRAPVDTPEACTIRAMAKDEGRFADKPQVFPITDQAYLAARLSVPVAAEQMMSQYRFYLLRFSFDLQPAAGWAFNKLAVQVEFDADETGNRPKVYALFPDKKFKPILEAGAKVDAGLGADMQFAAGLKEVQLSAGPAGLTTGGQAHAKAGVDTTLVVGPFSLDWKKALIKTSQAGLEWAWWELDGAEFNRGDDPGLMLVAQVPRTAKRVGLHGQFRASRLFQLFDFGLRNAILNLDEAMSRFFKGGAPYDFGPVDWDLTADMALEEAWAQENTKS
jgi:hypothetical protein